MMDRTTLENAVEAGQSTRDIAQHLNYSQTNVRYWLSKYNLVTKPALSSPKCKQCGETDTAQFYWADRDHTRLRGHYCKACDNSRVLELGRSQKMRAVRLKGGSCRNCGFDSWVTALEFHHLNPGTKDPSFGSFRYWSWSRLASELEKCILLCRNCHAGVHEGAVVI